MSKSQNTAIAPTSQVPEILKAIKDKLARLKKITDSAYKTSCNIGNNFTNLDQETKIENLLRAYALIKRKHDDYNDAATALDIQEYPVFTHNGFKLEDWTDDIKLRKAIIEQKETQETLLELQKEAEQFLSLEDKQAMFIDKMAKVMKSLPQ
jgi:hypothetical protein